MDNKNILNNIKLYKNLNNNKEKVRTIKLGLKFLEFFFEELKNLELESFDEKLSDLTSFTLYNYVEKKDIKILVSSKSFQEKMQFLYRSFIEKEYFSSFSWYNKFSAELEKFLRKDCNYTSQNAINLVISYVSDSLIFFSVGSNEFNYEKVSNYLENLFSSVGMEKKESKDFTSEIFNCLFKNNILIYKSSFFSFKKDFNLSDPFMDIVFNISSKFIGYIYDPFKFSIKINTKNELMDIEKFIENYTTNWTSREPVSKIYSILDSQYPEIMKKLLDYSVLDLELLNLNLPEHVLNSIKGFFFFKILLNEYCLQLIISSCFNHIFLNQKMKNILYVGDYTKLFKNDSIDY